MVVPAGRSLGGQERVSGSHAGGHISRLRPRWESRAARAGAARVVGRRGEGKTRLLVSGPPEGHCAAFTGGAGYRGGVCCSGEVLVHAEPLAVVAKLGEKRSVDAIGAEEGRHDRAVGEP